VLYAQYRMPILSSSSLWRIINKGHLEAPINSPLPYLRLYHHCHRGRKVNRPRLIEWLWASIVPQTLPRTFPQATFALLRVLPIKLRNYRRQLPLPPENQVFKHFHRR